MTYEESFDEVIKAMENLNKKIANKTDEFNIMIFNRLPAKKKKKIVKWMNKERKKYVKANIKAIKCVKVKDLENKETIEEQLKNGSD